jgi:hypothetical protein
MSGRFRGRFEDLYKGWIEADILVLSGLLAIPVIAIVQLLGNEEPLDLPLQISVHCFAVAIPLLASTILLKRHESACGRVRLPRWVFVGQPIALIADAIGLISLFWHFSWAVGVLALTSGVLAGAVYWHVRHNLQREFHERSQQKNTFEED